jgi:PPP family 3-phenylpropionic acid transporter
MSIGCSRLPWPLLVLETASGFRAAALVRLLKRDSLLASHEPSVTTVFSRSPNRAWIVRSLFASLRHAVRGLRRRVPIPARASSRARAWPSRIGSVLAAGTAVRLITGPVISRFVDRSGKRQQSLAVLVAMAAVVAFGYSLPAGFAIFLLVSVARASALAPIVPIADAMTLAAAPGRFQYGWVRGGASAAFVVGAVGAGQVTQATSLGSIVWMNGTVLALATVAALRLPRNALDRPIVQRQANVCASFWAPGFLPLMALAALVLGSHALHDGFEVLRWQEGHRAEHSGAIVVGGSPGGGCRFRAGGSNATEVAWVSRGGRAGCQRGNNPLDRHRCHRLAPAMVLVEPLHGLTFALLHLACMQMLSVIIPPALTPTAQAIYGAVAVGAMSAILSLVSGPLYGARGARAFWAMALLCAAALPIAFAMRGISINASGSKPIQPIPR